MAKGEDDEATGTRRERLRDDSDDDSAGDSA